MALRVNKLNIWETHVLYNNMFLLKFYDNCDFVDTASPQRAAAVGQVEVTW